MMKKLTVTILLAFATLQTFAQDHSETILVTKPTRKVNTVYAEAFGQALYYSINYDRLLLPNNRFPATVSAGITFLPVPSYMMVVATPFSFNGLIGKGSHHLELGIGITPMYFKEKHIQIGGTHIDDNGNITNLNDRVGYTNNFFFYATPKIGYRFQRPQGGFFGKITLTPPVGIISHWGGTRDQNSKERISMGGYTTYFKEAAFFDSPIFPWAGISFGWTF